MKRHKSLYPLSHDHHQGLILAQLIKKNAPKYKNLPDTIDGKTEYTINFYNVELVKHFRHEEEILFAAAKGKNENIDSLITEIATGMSLTSCSRFCAVTTTSSRVKPSSSWANTG